MIPAPVCFADIIDDLNGFLQLLREMIPYSAGIWILIGVLSLTSAGIFVWAAFFRKRRPYPANQRRGRRRHLRESVPSGKTEKRGLSRWFPGKHHRRRRHHRPRPRNPTLAESGGLPPVRTDSNPPGST